MTTSRTSDEGASILSMPIGVFATRTCHLGELCRAIHLCLNNEQRFDAGMLIILAADFADETARGINPISDPELVSLADRAYQLGSLCRAIGLNLGEERYSAAGVLALFASEHAAALCQDFEGVSAAGSLSGVAA